MADLDTLLRDRGLLPLGVGLPRFGTLAALRAQIFPVPQDGQQARVFGDPNPTLNGYYVFGNGDWGVDRSFYDQVSGQAEEAIEGAQQAALAATTALTALDAHVEVKDAEIDAAVSGALTATDAATAGAAAAQSVVEAGASILAAKEQAVAASVVSTTASDLSLLARDKSQDWAEGTGAPGGGATKSSKAWALLADTDAIKTGQDRTQTGIDRTNSATDRAAIAAALNGIVNPISITAATRAIMAGVASPTEGATAALGEGRRAGPFVWRGGNFTTNVANDPQQGVYVPHTTIPITTGCWVRALDSSPLTIWHFGAQGGSADDGVALNAFFKFCDAYSVSVDITGVFRSSLPFVIGKQTGAGEPATSNYPGKLVVTAAAAMAKMLTFRWLQYGTIGDITLNGTGSLAWSGRTCDVGFAYETCTRQTYGNFRANYFRFAGSLPNRGFNSSGSKLNGLRASGCGSGSPYAGESLTANWSSPVTVGGAGSAAQRTILTLDTDAPEWTLAYTDSWMLGGTMVRIGTQYYAVQSWDNVTKQVTLFPWIDPVDLAAGSGALKWILGAGYMSIGNDNNCGDLGRVDGSRCGRAFFEAALYGQVVAKVLAQGCGIGLQIGASQSSCINTQVQSYYPEANDCDVLMWTGTNWFGIGGTDELNVDKIFTMGGARATAATTGQPPIPHQRMQLDYLGRTYAYEKSSPDNTPAATMSQNVANYLSAIMTGERPATFSGEAFTVSLQATGWSSHLSRLFGMDTKQFALVGAAGVPTGICTFNAPAGYTINGGASAVFRGFSDAPTFRVTLANGSTDFKIGATGYSPVGPEGLQLFTVNGNGVLTFATPQDCVFTNVNHTAVHPITLPDPALVRQGRRFAIVRTPTCTGSNLDVKTFAGVTLKSLVAGGGSRLIVQKTATDFEVVGFGSY